MFEARITDENHVHDKDLCFTNGTLYMYSNGENRRIGDPGESELFSVNPPETFTDAATYVRSTHVPPVLNQLAYRRAEPVERRDRTAVRYVVSGASADSELTGYDHEGELLVSSEGGILGLTVASATTEGASITEEGNRDEFTLTGTGETSVETPSWFEGEAASSPFRSGAGGAMRKVKE